MMTDVLIIKAGIAHRERETKYNGQELGLCIAFQKAGLNARVIYFSDTVDTVQQSEHNREITYVPCRKLGNQAYVSVNQLKAFPTKAVFIMADNKLFVSGIINFYLKQGIVPVCYFGVLFSNSNKKIKKIVSRVILETNRGAFAKTINIAKTQAARNELEKYKIGCKDVIPVGLDMTKLHLEPVEKNQIRSDMKYDQADKIILFVGRFVPEKKAPYFVEMFAELHKRDSSYKAIIIGNGAERDQVKNKIQEMELRDSVKLIDGVEYANMYKYYCLADCFVNLSKIEIFGMAILESMFYGCPVVAHSAPGPDSIIEQGKTGWLLSGYNKYEWADRVEACVGEEVNSTVAKDSIIHNFTWDTIAKRIEKYFML